MTVDMIMEDEADIGLVCIARNSRGNCRVNFKFFGELSVF